MALSIFKLLTLIAGIPQAQACAVCFSAQGASLRAYWGTTILLILLPVSMVLGFVLWLYLQQRKPERRGPPLKRSPALDLRLRP